MLADYPGLDIENGLWTWGNYYTYSRDEISNLQCETYSKKLFTIAEKLQSYHLTLDEINVLRAIVMFNSGTPNYMYFETRNTLDSPV